MIVINGILAVIGLIASVLTIIQFFSSFKWQKVVTFLLVATFSVIVLLSWNHAKEAQSDLELAQQKATILKDDARVVTESIVDSGWEDAGDFVGHLSQIVGFFRRHKADYESEFTSYDRQLTEWQDFLKQKRTAGQTIYSSDWRDLRGTVLSGRRLLNQVAGIEK